MEKGKKVSSDKSSLGRIVADVHLKKKLIFSAICSLLRVNEKKIVEELVDQYIEKNKGVLKDV